MKHTLLIITALMLVVGCSSPEPINYETTLIIKNGVHYTKDTNKPYSGPVFSLRKDGSKLWEGTLKDGKQDGKWWKKYEGKKYVQIIFKDGEYDGKYTKWYDNGQKSDERTYKNGELIEETYWDEDGNVYLRQDQ